MVTKLINERKVTRVTLLPWLQALPLLMRVLCIYFYIDYQLAYYGYLVTTVINVTNVHTVTIITLLP
jgi:hypothetical protein